MSTGTDAAVIRKATETVREALQKENPSTDEGRIDTAQRAIEGLRLPPSTARAVMTVAREQGVFGTR